MADPKRGFVIETEATGFYVVGVGTAFHIQAFDAPELAPLQDPDRLQRVITLVREGTWQAWGFAKPRNIWSAHKWPNAENVRLEIETSVRLVF